MALDRVRRVLRELAVLGQCQAALDHRPMEPLGRRNQPHVRLREGDDPKPFALEGADKLSAEAQIRAARDELVPLSYLSAEGASTP